MHINPQLTTFVEYDVEKCAFIMMEKIDESFKTIN